MRVIAGTAKGLPLKMIDGLDTRPTTDRIKETLFNMLQMDIFGARFLDLFSGSGAIGIEALSRGAEYTVFVEKNKEMLTCIQENLHFTKLDKKASVMGNDVFHALRSLEMKKEPFHIIFMDPPYNQGLEKQVFHFLGDSILVNQETIIIVEASLSTDFSYLDKFNLQLIKQKKYKTNQHVFVKKR